MKHRLLSCGYVCMFPCLVKPLENLGEVFGNELGLRRVELNEAEEMLLEGRKERGDSWCRMVLFPRRSRLDATQAFEQQVVRFRHPVDVASESGGIQDR